MSLTRSQLDEGINAHIAELRDGFRPISSRFELKCDTCHQLVSRDLKVGDACPFFLGRGSPCRGRLILNEDYKP